MIQQVMKAKSRSFMIQWMEKKGIYVVGTTEEFNGQEGGIWIAADHDDEQRFFDYYTTNRAWVFGVNKKLSEQANKYGWYFSWNDPGTMMLWEI